MHRFFKKMTLTLCLFSVVSVGIACQKSVNSTSPVVVLKRLSKSMLADLKQNQSRLKSSPKLVEQLVRQHVLPIMNVPHMVATALGRQYWRKATPSQRAELSSELTQIIINTYAEAFASYDGDRMRFRRLRGSSYECVGATPAVQSLIVRPSGQRISVSYQLSQIDNKWKVYDFSIENLSIVSNYQQQFSVFFNQTHHTASGKAMNPIDALIQKLQQKLKS